MGVRAATIRKIALEMPAATENVQWGKDHVFKVAGKMFVCMGDEPSSGYSFKVDDGAFLQLIELPGIEPAPYLARAKWVAVRPKECELSRAEIAKLVRRSYELVVAKLPKKTQREIAEG